jgi:hypothetical protein
MTGPLLESAMAAVGKGWTPAVEGRAGSRRRRRLLQCSVFLDRERCPAAVFSNPNGLAGPAH